MQKNNFCPLPNKILVYEETDTISQSIFNSKRHLFATNHTNNKFINKKFMLFLSKISIIFIKLIKWKIKKINLTKINIILKMI